MRNTDYKVITYKLITKESFQNRITQTLFIEVL